MNTTITPSRAAQAALDGLVSLANDPAGRRLTLAEVFGTGHNAPEIEGVRALEALAMLDEAALAALAPDSASRKTFARAAAQSQAAFARAKNRHDSAVVKANS